MLNCKWSERNPDMQLLLADVIDSTGVPNVDDEVDFHLCTTPLRFDTVETMWKFVRDGVEPISRWGMNTFYAKDVKDVKLKQIVMDAQNAAFPLPKDSSAGEEDADV